MTEQPPIQTTPVGALRFNTDTSKLEYFDGYQFVNITTDSPEQNTGGTRGIFQLGYTTSYVTDVDFANISTTGNAQDFGFMTTKRGNGSFCFGSRTRDIRGNGYEVPANTSTNVMDFCTIASTGSFADFGDARKKVEGASGVSDSVRGIHSHGFQRTDWAYQADLQVTTIAHLGSTVDSGFDAQVVHHSNGASCASPVRGIFAGGNPTQTNVIDYITIQTLGKTHDFGDLTTGANEGPNMASNAVRGIYFCGSPDGNTNTNTISFITIATLGNAQDFGDSTYATRGHMCASSSTRVVRAGGYVAPTAVNTMDFVTISTRGDAINFGDLTTAARGSGAANSNGHGGLG